MPRYGESNRLAAIIAPWFCINNLTRSMGAAAVFEMAAAVPPIMKSATPLLEEGSPSKGRRTEKHVYPPCIRRLDSHLSVVYLLVFVEKLSED